MKGTRGEELAEGLGIVGTDKLIIKTRFSAFHQTSLDGILRRCSSRDPCSTSLVPPHSCGLYNNMNLPVFLCHFLIRCETTVSAVTLA